MLTDRQIEYLTQELVDIYSDIEIELIVSVAKRLTTYTTIGGTLEWQLNKLSELRVLNKDLWKIIKKYSGATDEAIEKMMKDAKLANVDKKFLDDIYKEGSININYDNLLKSEAIKNTTNSKVYELKETLSLINTKAIESARKGYIETLNKSYIEVASGVYSLDEAVSKNIKSMADKGFTGASYESGRTISIEAAVRRDTISAVNKLANEGALDSAKELGTNYVEVSSHLGARTSDKSKIANHAGWQGKVYMIEGSSPEYGNLVEETGYGTIEGLAGVNCRHRMFPFFPGISVRRKPDFDSQENKRIYKASQKLREMQRTFRTYKREREAFKAIGDKENYRKATAKCKDWSEKIDNFLESFPELRRGSGRELIKEELK